MQVCREAVLNTWPGSGKASVAKYVAYPGMRGTAHDLSVDELSHLGPSETKCMSSAKYGGAWPAV